jgi:hypothetical protein
VRWRRLWGSQESARSSKKLLLSNNQIPADGARALAEALRQPGAFLALELLDLNGNLIGNEGAHALAEALGKSAAIPALLGFDLPGASDEIRYGAARALAEFVGRQGVFPALLEIEVAGNRILVEFDVPGNLTGDAAARALAEALGQAEACPRLLYLTLADNDIGDEGQCALREACRQRKHGRRRCLRLNFESDAEYEAQCFEHFIRD